MTTSQINYFLTGTAGFAIYALSKGSSESVIGISAKNQKTIGLIGMVLGSTGLIISSLKQK